MNCISKSIFLVYVLIVSPVKFPIAVKRYGLCSWRNPIQFSQNTEACDLKMEIISE